MRLVYLLLVAGALGATVPSPAARSCGLCIRCNCSLRPKAIISKPFPTLMRIETLQYEGGLLGVKASVILDRRSETAFVNLRGGPIGGSISGIAKFKADGESVEVESELYHALGKRGVSIVNAGAYKDYSYVWVRVKLPLGLGTHRMILPRTNTQASIHNR